HMHGSGRLWLDDARIQVVPNDTPTTDDHNNHLYTHVAANYSAALDPQVQRSGHPTMRISSSTKPTGGWAWYGVNNRPPEPYLGHRIRVTAWIKTEKVTGSVRLSVWAWTPEGKLICVDDPASRKIIKGTTDWAKYDLTATVPDALDNLDPGFNLFGNG